MWPESCRRTYLGMRNPIRPPKTRQTRRGRPPIARRNRPPRLLAVNRVAIDLEGISMLRDAKRAESARIVLSATQNQVAIKLPYRSPKGIYDDPFGNSVRSAAGQSEDGVALRTNLNLSHVKPGKYMICVTRDSEVPDCVQATVRAP